MTAAARAARAGAGAVVLAGGLSTRMGRDKATLELGGEALLGRVVRRLAQACGEVVLVARRGQALPEPGPLPPGVRVRVAHDEVEGQGPLAALAAGLAALEAPVAYATSCDAPLVTPAFVGAVLEALGDAAAAVPFVQGRHHPLAAAYRREAVLPEARALLAAGRRRPVFLLERLPHVEVDEAALRAVDPALEALEACNTPEELEGARARLEARRVTFELYGIAAQRAARPEVAAEGRTLEEALLDLESRVPALAGEVLARGRLAPHWTASLDGRRFTEAATTPLRPGARVLLLSSLAGG